MIAVLDSSAALSAVRGAETTIMDRRTPSGGDTLGARYLVQRPNRSQPPLRSHLQSPAVHTSVKLGRCPVFQPPKVKHDHQMIQGHALWAPKCMTAYHFRRSPDPPATKLHSTLTKPAAIRNHSTQVHDRVTHFHDQRLSA